MAPLRLGLGARRRLALLQEDFPLAVAARDRLEPRGRLLLPQELLALPVAPEGRLSKLSHSARVPPTLS